MRRGPQVALFAEVTYVPVERGERVVITGVANISCITRPHRSAKANTPSHLGLDLGPRPVCLMVIAHNTYYLGLGYNLGYTSSTSKLNGGILTSESQWTTKRA